MYLILILLLVNGWFNGFIHVTKRCPFKKMMHTRIHSSRMRTGRTLTVSREGVYLPGPGGSDPGGVPAWSRGRCTCLVPGGVSAPGGVPAWSQGGGCTCLVPGGCLLPVGCTCLVPGGVSTTGEVSNPGGV